MTSGLFGEGFPALNAVDMSRWGGELTPTEAKCLRDRGVGLVLVGSGHPNGAGLWSRQQAQTSIAWGMQVDVYSYLYLAHDTAAQVRLAVNTMWGIPVRKWWLDMEDVDDDAKLLTVAQRHDALDAAIAELEALPKGIYSAKWWWDPYMRGSTKYSHLPLWNANYDGDPDTDGLPFGGWTESEIEQYQGTTDLCGQSVDLNYAKKLGGDMSAADVARIDRLERLVAGWGYTNDEGVYLKDEAALTYVDERQRTLFEGLRLTQNDLANLAGVVAEIDQGKPNMTDADIAAAIRRIVERATV